MMCIPRDDGAQEACVLQITPVQAGQDTAVDAHGLLMLIEKNGYVIKQCHTLGGFCILGSLEDSLSRFSVSRCLGSTRRSLKTRSLSSKPQYPKQFLELSGCQCWAPNIAGYFISPIKCQLVPSRFAKTCFYEPLMKARKYNKKERVKLILYELDMLVTKQEKSD